MLWTITGGVPRSLGIIDSAQAATAAAPGMTFLQISDSHVGFDKPANPNALGTLEEAINKINAMPVKPSFMIHTGDITHLSKAAEFDNADRIISQSKLDVHYVPGEHDFLDEEVKFYRERYGRGTKGAGWYSFDAGGVHFIGLVNVVDLKAGGLGNLGAEQLALARGRSARQVEIDTDRAVCPHPALDRLSGMGLGHGGRRPRAGIRQGFRLRHRAERPHPSSDAEGRGQRHLPHRALDCVPAAGAGGSSVTRTDEGRERKTARHARRCQRQLQAERTAARDHRHAAPRLSRAERKLTMKTLNRRDFAVDLGLALAAAILLPATTARADDMEVHIDNFVFQPAELKIKVGTTVTWSNRDDIPHTVVSAGKFRSKTLDTDDKFSFTFTNAGDYKYFCSLHPHMTGMIKVE
ncbi:plastocyanin [Bradyrhizobium sp. LB9.1b]